MIEYLAVKHGGGIGLCFFLGGGSTCVQKLLLGWPGDHMACRGPNSSRPMQSKCLTCCAIAPCYNSHGVRIGEDTAESDYNHSLIPAFKQLVPEFPVVQHLQGYPRYPTTGELEAR